MTDGQGAEPDPRAVAFAAELNACLDAADPTAAFLAFIPQMPRTRDLPRQAAYGDPPNALVGIACAFVAGAMVAVGRAADVYPFLGQVADLFAPERRYYVRGSNIGDLLSHFVYLQVPLIRSAIAERDQDDAVAMVNDFARSRARQIDYPDPALQGPLIAGLIARPAAAAFGPFGYDHAWVLDRQDEILDFLTIDPRQERVRDFEERYLENALRTHQVDRALKRIEGRMPESDGPGPAPDNFEFLGFCALASAGRFDEARAAARAIVRRGFSLRWRFDPERAAEMAWTQVSRQNEHIAELAETRDYQAFLDEDVRYRKRWDFHPLTEAGPPGSLSGVRDDVLGGKKGRKCAITRKLIAPGDPIVRFRLLFAPTSDGEFEVATKAAFETEGWRKARAQFENDDVPVEDLFPPRTALRETWDEAALDAFAYDVGKDPGSVDVARAVKIVAAHQPQPIRFYWRKPGEGDWRYAFEPLIGDEGHGQVVNLIWRLVKAGFREAILEQARGLGDPLADKVFAMLATFDDAVLRDAAASHFGLPDLPAMMDLVFSEPLTLYDHITLADYGDAHPRFRAALVHAMRAYALHIYSNSHPGVDWWLQRLEHYRLAHCSHLLSFLIRHSEDDVVLAEMIEKRWIPAQVGTGGYDAYGNAAPFYYRTLVLNRALVAPDDLDFWLTDPWVLKICDRSQDRHSRKLAEKLRKSLAKPARRAKG